MNYNQKIDYLMCKWLVPPRKNHNEFSLRNAFYNIQRATTIDEMRILSFKSAFSFLIIALGRGASISTVSHEYGHHKQQRLMGLSLYTSIVAISSLISVSRNTGTVHSSEGFYRV